MSEKTSAEIAQEIADFEKQLREAISAQDTVDTQERYRIGV
jgi:hypothetical protein